MSEDARAATIQLLARRQEVLAAGAAHVGWKVGLGDRERIGDSIAVGYVTSASVLGNGATWPPRHVAELHADVELAVEIGARGEPRAYAIALELVDLAPVLSTAAAVIAANVFHRAVAFGEWVDALPRESSAAALVDGTKQAFDDLPTDAADRVAAVAAVLSAAGEQVREGDRIITGSIVQVPVSPGTFVEADAAALGRVGLRIAG